MTTQKIECPNGHPAPDWASPGDTITCQYCSTRYSVEAPAAADSFVSITAKVVSIGGDTVAGDKNVVNYGPGATPPASVEPFSAVSTSGGFVCPTCKGAVAVKKNRPGKRYLCLSCRVFSQVSADATCLELVNMPPGDVGGDGKGVDIDAGDKDVDADDVVGRFNVVKK